MLVKVIDFGLAKAVVADAAAPGGPSDTRGDFVGTPAFASPEQFARAAEERIDTRSDIYSLGVTLWFLLCGKTPFVGETLAQVQARQREALPVSQLQAARVPGPRRVAPFHALGGPGVAPAIRARTAGGSRRLSAAGGGQSTPGEPCPGGVARDDRVDGHRRSRSLAAARFKGSPVDGSFRGSFAF